MSGGEQDEEFLARRRRMLAELDQHPANEAGNRADFFNAVYTRAGGDAAGVPWADLKPKTQLIEWLETHPGNGRTAIDIACGLGDNAEALAATGYRTTAFDLSSDAIDWARSRFPESEVDYRAADLFDPPDDWRAGFDLVHECYTLQALPPDMLPRTIAAISRLVAPGGTLLVYTRIRANGSQLADGPPWPLQESEAMRFEDHGLTLVGIEPFENVRHDRVVPHWFCEWRRSA